MLKKMPKPGSVSWPQEALTTTRYYSRKAPTQDKAAQYDELAVLLCLPIAQVVSLLLVPFVPAQSLGAFITLQVVAISALPFMAAMAVLSKDKGQALVLLILPWVTATATLSLTVAQGATSFFVSDAFNYYDYEPWAFWLLRWSLWHATFIGIFLFKRAVFPPQLQWVAYFNLATILITLWSGFSQGYVAYQWVPARYLHWAAALGVAVTFGVETPILWVRGWHSLAYVVIVKAYLGLFLLAKIGWIPDTGIPLVHNNIGQPLQWIMFFFHLILVHRNYPRVRFEGFASGSLWGRGFGSLPAGDFHLEFFGAALFAHKKDPDTY